MIRRVVTGHDENGKSVVLSDGPPPQHHPMHGPGVGADFIEVWNSSQAVPELSSTPASEPNERPFTIMPPSGHLIRVIKIYPPQEGGQRTAMHRTKTLDYAVVIEGEIVLILDDSEVVLKPATSRSSAAPTTPGRTARDKPALMAFFHIDAEFSPELLAKLPQPLNLMA